MSRRGKNQVNCNDSEEHIKECYGMGKYMEELWKNEQKMQAVLDASPDVIHMLDSNGIILSSNEVFAKRMGLKLDDIIGKNVFDYFPGELALKRKAALDTVFKTGEPLEFEDEGRIGIFESHINPVFNEAGEVTAVVVYARDIAERKKAEQSLQEAEAELKHTIEVVPGIIAEANVHTGYFTHCNPALTNILGFSLEEFLARPFIEFIHPDDRQDTINEVEKQLKGRPTAKFENRYICKDGTCKWLEWMTTAADEKGVVYASATDITERKKAEEALIKSKRRAEDEKAWSEGILESIGDAISIQDLDFKILYQNESHKNLMRGHVGEYCYKAYEDEDDVCEGCPVASAFEDGGTHLAQRVVPGIHVEIMASVLRDHAGKIVAGIEVVRDIAERKKMEELHIENQSLALADKTKSEFLSIMSHELRTPLNSSIGFSDLLKRGNAGKLNAKQEKFVDNIYNSSKHLLELINDILDISSIEAGKMKLDIEKISLPDFIEENLFLLNVLATERKVIFKKDVAPETGVIECDKQRLRQILFNLVDNAIKFSKEEGGIVTITAWKDGNMVTISVSDTGIGIKEDDIGKLFKNFTQLDTGYSRKYGGTGLGLAVTSKLVELHGGDIWVESKYGEGSTFTFTLPIKVKV